jgi:methylated-DNA-[protein]-cysteine S-methyltransferase
MVAFETGIGLCAVQWGESGLIRVWLPGMPASGGRSDAGTPAWVRAAVDGIVALLDGEPTDLRSVALDDRSLGDFDRAVYAATRSIDPGSTASYGDIARTIGAGPNRARAVGAALGRNPFPIVVPCHRVLAADGSLHGFSAPGGIATKRRMLEIERAPGFVQEALFAG